MRRNQGARKATIQKTLSAEKEQIRQGVWRFQGKLGARLDLLPKSEILEWRGKRNQSCVEWLPDKTSRPEDDRSILYRHGCIIGRGTKPAWADSLLLVTASFNSNSGRLSRGSWLPSKLPLPVKWEPVSNG